MFTDYESSGKHMVCDLKGIKNNELLNNTEQLIYVLKKICIDYDYQILGEVIHKFDPIGCSIIFLLSESHLSIHTFPEKNHISFDIYTCRQYKDNIVYNEIYQYLLNMFDANNLTSKSVILDRYF